MAIDNLSEQSADLDVPEWMRPGASLAKPEADTETDAADSRALVAAKASGRAIGTAARWLNDSWPATGARGASRAGHRYVRVIDRIESIEPSTPSEWDYIDRIRRRRWITCACNAAALAAGSLGAWIGTVAGIGMTAAPGLEAAVTTEGAVAALAATLYGRAINRRPAELEAGEQPAALGPGRTGRSEDDGEPFPLAQCETADEVRVCVWRALKAEGIPVAEVYDIAPRQWGYQCIVRVSEGTPEAIIAKAGALETRLDLPANGVRPQPMVERRACAILRLVGGDPFASAPGVPYRAPKSLSITDKFRIGTSVGGDPLMMSLAGVMGLFVAASGGGKTGILQALGEGTTACRDNVTIDLDPHGDGLEDLYDAVRVTARTTEQIEAVLLFFLVMSKGRARLRKKLGMGKKWIASPEHPAVTLIFDEFPKASELAKRLAFDLLLVGRKELIDLEIASQGGTKLYLGENIAQMIALKAVGPCKVGDTRAVFGDGAVSEGWLPHRLSPATDTDPKDAGHVYLQGVPGIPDEPVEYKVHEMPAALLRKLAAERKDAGLVEPDRDSLDAMAGVDLPEYVEAVYDLEGNLKKEAPVELLSWDQLLRLCDAEPPAGAAMSRAATVVADAVALMDRFGVDRLRTEALLAALADHDPDTYGDATADELKALLAEAGAGKPVTLGQMDGLANPRGFKRDQLTACM